jgi:hypothetical protein
MKKAIIAWALLSALLRFNVGLEIRPRLLRENDFSGNDRCGVISGY